MSGRTSTSRPVSPPTDSRDRKASNRSCLDYSPRGDCFGFGSAPTYLSDWVWLPLLIMGRLPSLCFSGRPRSRSMPSAFGPPGPWPGHGVHPDLSDRLRRGDSLHLGQGLEHPARAADPERRWWVAERARRRKQCGLDNTQATTRSRQLGGFTMWKRALPQLVWAAWSRTFPTSRRCSRPRTAFAGFLTRIVVRRRRWLAGRGVRPFRAEGVLEVRRGAGIANNAAMSVRYRFATDSW